MYLLKQCPLMSVFADRNLDTDSSRTCQGQLDHDLTERLDQGAICFQVQDFLDTASGQDQAIPNLLSLIPDGFLLLSCLL